MLLREPGSAVTKSEIRILVIEDDQEIADFLLKGMREEGWLVEHATTGGAGASKIANESWDLIVLDRSLPDQDGIDLLRDYRAEDGETPVLMLTAKDSIADRVAGLDAGANDYLCKPFAFEEMLARARALTRQHSRRSDSPLRYLDVSASRTSFRCERAGNKLDLTTKERALLLYFIQHPETPLTRQRIFEEVWEDVYDPSSNTLQVHVMELRRKLEVFGSRLIHTVRGHGYSFGMEENAGKETSR